MAEGAGRCWWGWRWGVIVVVTIVVVVVAAAVIEMVEEVLFGWRGGVFRHGVGATRSFFGRTSTSGYDTGGDVGGWRRTSRVGRRVRRVGEIGVVASIRRSIDPAHPSRFLMPIRTHVRIRIVLLPARIPLLLLFWSPGGAGLHERSPRQLPIHLGDYTPTPQLGRAGRPAQSLAVGPFAAQDRRFVILPVALAEVKPSILGPEEEPDRSQNERGSEQGKEREDASIVDGSGIESPLTGLGLTDGRGGVASHDGERGWNVVVVALVEE